MFCTNTSIVFSIDLNSYLIFLNSFYSQDDDFRMSLDDMTPPSLPQANTSSIS